MFRAHDSECCDEVQRLIEETHEQDSHHGSDDHGEHQRLAHTSAHATRTDAIRTLNITAAR